MARLTPSTETLKRLFARSGNKCAFPGCNRLLFNGEGTLIAEVCHIEGAEPGGERHNSAQTDEQRRDLGNLLVMCHEHHKITDDVTAYPVDRLQKIKADHEAKYSSAEFTVTDLTLERIVKDLKDGIAPLLNSALSSAIQPMQEMLQQLIKLNSPLPTDAPAALQRLIQKFQEDEPSVKIDAHTTSAGTTFSLRPASPDQPVVLAEVSFPDNEAGRRGLEKFRRAIETGCDVEILPNEHHWEPKLNLPAALLVAPTASPTLKLQPNTFLRQHMPPTPVRVQCYKMDAPETIASFDFARLQILRFGTKEVEFRLTSGQLAANLIFIHRFEEKASIVQFEIDLSKVRPNYALETLKLFEALESKIPLRFSIDSLDIDAPLIEGRLTTTSSALSLDSIRFTKQLLQEICEINRLLGLDLRYPMSPNLYLGMELKLVYGLLTGETVFGETNQKPIPITINCREAQRLLTLWEEGQGVDIPLPVPPTFSIAGCKIDIPGASYVLRDVKPALSLTEFEALIKSNASPDAIISFEVTCSQIVYYPAKKKEEDGSN